MRAAPFLVCFFLFSCSPPLPTEPEPGVPLEPTDAGEVVDAGASDFDAGIDAGIEPRDAGTDPIDAGHDAGTIVIDAGMDAGVDAGVDAGQPCTCALPSFCSNNVCVVDATTPAITVTASAGSTAGKLRVSGTAVDGETGISAVSVRVNQAAAVTLPVTMGTFSGEVDSTDLEFIVVVTGRDAAGNEGIAQTTFDPTGPRISLTPADGVCDQNGCHGSLIIATTTSFTVTATIEELALAPTSPVTIRVVSTTGTVLVPTTDMQRSGSSWIWTWANLPTLDSTDVHFIVTATDAAQNVSTATVATIFDRIGPVITMTPAQDGSCDQNGCSGAVITSATNSFVFSGTVEAVDLRIRIRDGASVVVPSSEVSINMGTWSWTWNAPPLVDGRPMTAEITATDMLGNTTTASRIVLVDRVAPSILVASPSAGALVGTSSVAVSANAADGLGIKAVEVTPSPSGVSTTATLDANGDYVANIGVPVVDAVEQTLTFRAVDLVGNSRSATRRYVADRVAPVVTIGGADFDCSGAECTGLVANRNMTSVGFTGTVTDGSAITLQKTIFGTSQLATSTDPASSGAWSWAWSSLPSNVNGAAYELRVVATDAAGNASAPSVRRVWRDDVAPTVSILPSGQRNVSPTAPLVNFSETMVLNSVLNGTGFSPPVGLATLSTTDRRTFAFASPAFAPYTSQRVVVASATDLAGNQIAVQADGTFLTAPVARGAVTEIRPGIPGYTHRHPVVAVDSDQQIYASYNVITSSGTVVESMVFDGTGLQRGRANSWGLSVREGELRIASETRGPDQRLAVSLEHSVVFGYASGPQVGYGTQPMAWTSQGYDATGFQMYPAGATVGGTATSLDLVRPTLDWVPTAFGSRRNFVAPNNGATAMNSLDQNTSNASWITTTPAALANFRRLDGRASVESTATLGQYRVRYYDLGAMSEVGTFGFVRAVTGQPALKRVDQFTTVANSGGFLAWMSDTQLTIACSPAPFVASPVWRSTVFPMPQTQSSTLTSTRDNTKVVFASEFGGSVYVHSTPLNGCTAAPVVKELRVIPGLKEPNVFIDARGIVWVAGIATDGAVVVHQI